MRSCFPFVFARVMYVLCFCDGVVVFRGVVGLLFVMFCDVECSLCLAVSV